MTHEWTRMEANVKAGQNPEELFDVVDERDQVLRSAPRREVHAGKLLHRAIHVFVFHSDGRIFLQQRSLLKDSAPGLWSASCSGHVDAGEDYDSAAARELAEELGLVTDIKPERWLRFKATEETGWEFLWVYKIGSNGPFQLNPAEIQDGDWFTKDQITQGVVESPEEFSESFRYLWLRLCEEL